MLRADQRALTVEALVPNASGSQTFGVNLVAQADEEERGRGD